MKTLKGISVFWFRRDLRLHDNIGLLNALDSKYPVLPIFIFDSMILSKLEHKKDARVQFIHDQVLKLKSTLEEHGSTLMIFFNKPKEVFLELNHKFIVKKVFANRDYEPYAISRDKTIAELLSDQKISFHLFKDQLIFEGHEIVKSDGTPYKVFTPFKRLWLQKFNDLGKVYTIHNIPFNKFHKTDASPHPTLKSIGFEPTTIEIPSSEINLKIIREYEQKRNYPALDATSRLGIHFRFGILSIREKVEKAKQYSDSFLNELIWREFYSAILQHFPYVASGAFNKKYDLLPWRNNEFEFQKWCLGKTGYPIVDAGMRQLNETGFMHNRVRMITASFLTKHLLIDWRWGESYFAQKLLDFELASNNGGWQWAAGTGTDAQPYFRVFNPESQARKFDSENRYIKKWIPEFGTSEYVKQIVDHKLARNRAIETYKAVVSK